MGRRGWLNVWLAGALAVLVWVVWQEPGHAPKPTVKLTALAPAAIDRVSLVNPGGTLRLAKQDGRWAMLAPYRIAANPVRVDDLLQVAAAESRSQFPAAGKDLAPFGLAKPAITLRLNDTEIAFGTTTPVDLRRYVRIGDTIHLIDDQYSYDLTADAAAYVSRDLLPPGAKLDTIGLPDRSLSLGADGKWSAKPAAPDVGEANMQALADAWQQAQAVRVQAYDKRPGQGAVVLGLAGGQASLRYEIIAREPELILARPELGLQYYLPKEDAGRLLALKPPADKDKDKHK